MGDCSKLFPLIRPVMSPDPSLLTTRQVAGVLQVHPKHVYRLLRRGLPAHRVGGQWRFIEEEVRRWVHEGSNRTPARHREGDSGGRDSDGWESDGRAPAILAANGDLAVESLLQIAWDLGPPYVGLLPADRSGGLELLQRGAVLAAGYHGGPDIAAAHASTRSLVRLHLVRRDVGLAARNPRSIPSLEDLPRIRLASRPPTAGVRQHLDLALRTVGVDSDEVHRKALVLSSHREVVLAVARGEADVGISTQSWSRRLRLAFAPLVTEEYGILTLAVHLDDPRLLRLLSAARSPAFRDVVGPLGGYDPERAGEITVLSAGSL